MLRVAIIGCGKIADSHAEQIARIGGCEIVGVCDQELLMAKQLYERFRIGNIYNDVDRLLADARPDVVHITTPPQSHLLLGRKCLEAGAHVYIEKPFTVYCEEAAELLELAAARGRKITVGHDDQYTNVARQMRELVHGGFLGGEPLHIESYYCYDFTSGEYAKALLGDSSHWVRRLPGKLLQNVISHGISKVAEFITADCPEVIATGFVSPALKAMGIDDIVDELRVLISWNERSTAYFTFSSQMRPVLKHLRLFGSRNAICLDHDQQTLIKVPGSRHKSYLEKFVPPFEFSRQFAANGFGNIGRFLRRDLHMKSGMKYLIEAFYRSIRGGSDVPIPYREILLTSRIMDDIFSQLEKSVGRPAC